MRRGNETTESDKDEMYSGFGESIQNNTRRRNDTTFVADEIADWGRNLSVVIGWTRLSLKLAKIKKTCERFRERSRLIGQQRSSMLRESLKQDWFESSRIMFLTRLMFDRSSSDTQWCAIAATPSDTTTLCLIVRRSLDGYCRAKATSRCLSLTRLRT